VLRACKRVLRPSGRMAFLTIHTADGADTADRRAARYYGPRMVNASSDYQSLLARSGFHDIRAYDLTTEFLRISLAWERARERHADALIAALGEARVREMRSDSRLNIEGIRRGLLRRSLFVATR